MNFKRKMLITFILLSSVLTACGGKEESEAIASNEQSETKPSIQQSETKPSDEVKNDLKVTNVETPDGKKVNESELNEIATVAAEFRNDFILFNDKALDNSHEEMHIFIKNYFEKTSSSHKAENIQFKNVQIEEVFVSHVPAEYKGTEKVMNGFNELGIDIQFEDLVIALVLENFDVTDEGETGHHRDARGLLLGKDDKGKWKVWFNLFGVDGPEYLTWFQIDKRVAKQTDVEEDSQNTQKNITTENLVKFKKVEVGNNHVLAIAEDNTVWVKGENLFAQLGLGNTSKQMSFVKIKGLDNVVDVKAGDGRSMALLDDGSVWIWGKTSANMYDPRPVKVNELENIVAIEAGDSDRLALNKDGDVFIQAITGGLMSTFEKVEGLPKIKRINAYYGASIAIDEDTMVWILSYNNEPYQIDNVWDVIDASADFFIKDDHTLWFKHNNQLQMVNDLPPVIKMETDVYLNGEEYAAVTSEDRELFFVRKDRSDIEVQPITPYIGGRVIDVTCITSICYALVETNQGQKLVEISVDVGIYRGSREIELPSKEMAKPGYKQSAVNSTVTYLIEKGILEISESNIDLNEPITRGEFIELLVNAKIQADDVELVQGRKSFRDVPQDHPLNPYVEAAIDHNIIFVADFGPNFELDKTIDRAEMFIHTARALRVRIGLTGREGHVYSSYKDGGELANLIPERITEQNQNSFYGTDVKNLGRTIAAVLQKGIIAGDSDGSIKPLEPAKKGYALELIMRTYDQLKKSR
jgi:hypothetical protein